MLVDGPTVRHLRERNGDNLAAFAAKAGISLQHLSRIERGQRSPSPEVVGRIAKALRVKVDAILPAQRDRAS